MNAFAMFVCFVAVDIFLYYICIFFIASYYKIDVYFIADKTNNKITIKIAIKNSTLLQN